MGAHRYGTPFQLFKLIAANEWDIELNTGREIPFLRAIMYYFVYYIDTICLYCEENSTLCMSVKIGSTIHEKKSIGSVMLGNVKATIFWKYHCLIYSTFLSLSSFSLQRKRKGCTEWIAYTCSGNRYWLFIPLVIDRGFMVQEYIGK